MTRKLRVRSVTLVVTICGPKTIWLLADRRLSFKGRPPKDDARKVMFLETTDGMAILGYAGLGSAILGTEPSFWMSAVLRTRNAPLEQSLGALAEAMKKQFPRHMIRMPGVPVHNTIVPAFVGGEPRLYTIDLEFSPDRKSYRFRWARHRVGTTTKPPRIGLGGTGGAYLLQRKDKKWIRNLLRAVKAFERGRVSPDAVADCLAALNYEVSRCIRDNSVGPRCVIAWRHKTGGGENAFYTGTIRDADSPCLPTVARGIDIEALIALPHNAEVLEAMLAGRPVKEPSEDEINTELGRLPTNPTKPFVSAYFWRSERPALSTAKAAISRRARSAGANRGPARFRPVG